MVAAQSNKLFANGAATICFSLAAFCVLNHTFHLLTGWQRAVCISTLAGMDKGLDTALDTEATRVSRALSGSGSLAAALVIQTETKLLHLVLMALSVVTSNAQVIVLWGIS